MKHVLLNGYAARVGGGAAVLRGIAEGLAAAGDVRVTVIVRDPGLVPDDVDTFVPRETSVPRLVVEPAVVRDAIRSTGADIVVGLSNTVPRVDITSAVLVQNVAPFDPGVRRQYRSIGRARLEALRRLTVRSARRADVLLALSEHAGSVISSASGRRCRVIVPGAPIPPPSLSCGRDPRLLVVLADLYRYKGVEDAVRALALPELADRRLVVIGRPIERSYAKRLTRLVEQLAVGDRVAFEEGLDRGDIWATLAGAGCLVHTSRCESLSLPLLEAASIRTPIATTALPVVTELCRGAATYDPGDVEGLSAAIRQAAPTSLVTPDASWRGTAEMLLAAVSA